MLLNCQIGQSLILLLAGVHLEFCLSGNLAACLVAVVFIGSNPFVTACYCMILCIVSIVWFVIMSWGALYVYSLRADLERLIENSYGTATLELPRGIIISACPRFHQMVAVECVIGQQFRSFLILDDRARLDDMLSSAIDNVFISILATIQHPNGRSLDAVLVPYSGNSNTVKVCVQSQGEVRHADIEESRSPTGIPRETMEPSIDFATGVSSLNYEWQCQQCLAFARDWGNITTYSSDGISLHSFPPAAPRSNADPGPGLPLRRALLRNGHHELFLAELQRWRPLLYHEVTSTLQQWDHTATQLAPQLRQLAEQRRRAEFDEASALILDLQLVALRVSSQFGARGLGIATCWPIVISFILGIDPLNHIVYVWPLLPLISPPLPDIESHREWTASVWTMMARRIPWAPPAAGH